MGRIAEVLAQAAPVASAPATPPSQPSRIRQVLASYGTIGARRPLGVGDYFPTTRAMLTSRVPLPPSLTGIGPVLDVANLALAGPTRAGIALSQGRSLPDALRAGVTGIEFPTQEQAGMAALMEQAAVPVVGRGIGLAARGLSRIGQVLHRAAVASGRISPEVLPAARAPRAARAPMGPIVEGEVVGERLALPAPQATATRPAPIRLPAPPRQTLQTGNVPVTYVGKQEGGGVMPDFHLVNEPSGTTVEFNPIQHEIVGAKAGVSVPAELQKTSVGAMVNPGYVLKGQPFEGAIIAYEQKAGLGTFEQLSPKAQLEVISNTPEAEPVRDIIRRVTGQVKSTNPVSEAVALRRLFQREAQVAQQAFRQGKQQAITETSPRMQALQQEVRQRIPELQALRRSLQRQAQASKEGERAGKQAVESQLRPRIVQLQQEIASRVTEQQALKRSLTRQAQAARQAASVTKAQTLEQISQLFREPRKFLKVAQAKALTPTQIARMAKLYRVQGAPTAPLTPADIRQATTATARIVPRQPQITGQPPRIPRQQRLVPYYPKGRFRDLSAWKTGQGSGLEPRRAARIVDQAPDGPTTRAWLGLHDAEISAGQEWQRLNNELRRLAGPMPRNSPAATEVTTILEQTHKGPASSKNLQTAAWWRQEADGLLNRVNQLRQRQGKTTIVRRAGYMTHLQDKDFWLALRETLTGQDPRQLATLGDFIPEALQPSSRFFLRRKGGPYLIDPLKAFEVYARSLLRVIHVSDPAKIMESHARQLGPNAQHYFRRVIKQATTAFPGEVAQALGRPLSRIIGGMTTRFSRGTVLGNVSSVVMQPWSLPATMRSLRNPVQGGIAAKWLAEGTGGAFAEQWSKTLQGRLVEGLDPGLLTGYARLTDKFAGAMTGVDRAMVAHSFLAHYLDEIAAGTVHATAVAQADAATALTQAEFLRSTLAPIFADEITRAAVPFQTTINTIFNGLLYDQRWTTGRAWRGAAMFAGTAAAMGAVYDALGLPRPKGWMDWIPGLSSFRGGPPVIRVVAEAIRGLTSPQEWERERAMRNTLRTLTVTALGPPSNQVIKSLAGLQAVAAGGSFTATGRQRFPVRGVAEGARAVVFGPYQTKAGQEYIQRGFKPVPLTEEQKQLNRLMGNYRRKILGTSAR